jgi:chorismate mutase / prephenate dehydratase
MSEKPGRPPPPAPTAALRELRQRLDGIDEDLIRLIASRMETVGLIIAEKQGHTAGIRDSKREHEVLSRVETLARGAGISVPLARKIFSELISHSVSRQASTLTGLGPEAGLLRVAYVGSPFTFNHLAAQKFSSELDQPADFVGQLSVKDAIAALESEQVELAFLNIESTAAGSINQVYDVLREKQLHIVGEETIKVDLCLCGLADVPLSAVQRVLSHPLALEQSSIFLDALPNAKAVPIVDTAEAMRLTAEGQDPTTLAIGSPEAAEAHGLSVVRRGIGNHEEILHRYVALARSPVKFDTRIPCRTSLILSTRHEHGALLRCLETLGNHGLSLTKLESRPHPDRPWEYMFFADFEGNTSDPRVAAALDELRSRALFLKILGCYPAKATPAPAHLPGIRAAASAGAPPEAPSPSSSPGADSRLALDPQPDPSLPTLERRPAAPPRSTRYRLADRASRSDDTLVRVGNLLIGGDGFVVMAGPASVESEEQINATARFVRDRGAHVLRGGVFRSRTSGDGFPGLGLPGLELLAAAGRAVGMPVVTEVMSPEDVRPVAERADILQIGARNMQNFPLLGEVARVNRPVLLKRGWSATIDEWLAAAEYVLTQGNGQVILCERGIRTFESATPSTLDLSAVVVVRERTHLPVLVDPSHGTGRRAYVAPMAWAARACGAHGLLIEVHPEPEKALHQAEASLDFPEFAALMDGLTRWRA